MYRSLLNLIYLILNIFIKRSQYYDADHIILSKIEMLKMYASLNIESRIDTIAKTSFVLINPHFDYKLEQNDIIYILRPGNINIDWKLNHTRL